MRGPASFRRLSLPYRAVLQLLPAHVREEHAREIALDARPTPWVEFTIDILRAAPAAHLDVFRQDLGLALRQVRRAPAFALIAVVTLSLGLGGNLAFFTLVDGVLFRPLRLDGASHLVSISEENLPRGMARFGMAPANYRDYVADTSLFEAATAYQVRSATLQTGDAYERVLVASVSGEFFRVFTEPPALGRTLVPGDDVVDGNAIVVSHAFHQGALGADPGVLGREVVIDGVPLRIVGVMPARFQFPAADVAIWRPLGMPAAQWAETRGARFLSAVARLRAGVSLTRAREALNRVAVELQASHAATNTGWTVLVRDLRSARVDVVRSQLYLVWAAGALVLLVAITNVAGLFLSRALTRAREFAVRSALGARTGRVTRQVTAEALVLTVIGTLAGLALALLILEIIRITGESSIPRLDEVSLGWRTVALAGVQAVVTALILGALSVPSVRRRDPWAALGSGRAGASRTAWRLHRALVGGEVAVATFVLVGGALVARTMAGLLTQSMGFDPSGVVTFRVEAPFHVAQGLPQEAFIDSLVVDHRRASERYASLMEQLRALPGVSAAGAINRLPLSGSYWVTSVGIADRPSAAPEDRERAWIRPVTTGYLEAMRTRLIRGRAFEDADATGGERTAIVDEVFARRVWGDADPIGRELAMDGPPSHADRARIVGVAEGVHMNRLDAEPMGTVYVPASSSLEGFFPNWGMDVVVRTTGGLSQLPEFRRLVRDAFPDGVTFGARAMDDVVRASLADRRFQLLMLGLFSGLALVLVTVGVGGALLLVVRERRRELAVRIALGARLTSVWWHVQAVGLSVVALGAAAGCGMAFAGATVFASLVHGVSVRDPLAFVAAPVVLLMAAFAAVAVPATRATRVPPTQALREA